MDRNCAQRGNHMKIGVMMFPTDKAIQPIELAKETEARGFESLWFPEHSHIPTSRVTPWGGNAAAPPLPEEYWRSHDQFVALAAAAAVTENLVVATGITLVAQRDPLWLAKEVASLDAISNGRFILGIGYGWNKEELAHHGVKYTERRAVLRERMLAMREIWSNDEAEYHGEHVDFSSSWSWPKPTQPGGPPVILGGSAGPRTIKDIVEFCDGWMPISGRYDLVGKIAEVRQAAEDAGRDPNELEFGQFGTPPKVEVIESLAEAGVERVVLGLPPAPADKVLPILDSHAELLARFN
jgi:probable F420-dependent oxidoreductase